MGERGCEGRGVTVRGVRVGERVCEGRGVMARGVRVVAKEDVLGTE